MIEGEVTFAANGEVTASVRIPPKQDVFDKYQFEPPAVFIDLKDWKERGEPRGVFSTSATGEYEIETENYDPQSDRDIYGTTTQEIPLTCRVEILAEAPK